MNDIKTKIDWINHTLDLVKDNVLSDSVYRVLLKKEAVELAKNYNGLSIWKQATSVPTDNEEFWINTILKDKIKKENTIENIKQYALPILEDIVTDKFIDEVLFEQIFFYFFQLPDNERRNFYLKDLSDLPLTQLEKEKLIEYKKSDSSSNYEQLPDFPQKYSRYYHDNLHTYLYNTVKILKRKNIENSSFSQANLLVMNDIYNVCKEESFMFFSGLFFHMSLSDIIGFVDNLKESEELKDLLGLLYSQENKEKIENIIALKAFNIGYIAIHPEVFLTMVEKKLISIDVKLPNGDYAAQYIYSELLRQSKEEIREVTKGAQEEAVENIDTIVNIIKELNTYNVNFLDFDNLNRQILNYKGQTSSELNSSSQYPSSSKVTLMTNLWLKVQLELKNAKSPQIQEKKLKI